MTGGGGYAAVSLRLLFFQQLRLDESESEYLIKNSKTKPKKKKTGSASNPSSICGSSHFPLRFNTLVKVLIPQFGVFRYC